MAPIDGQSSRGQRSVGKDGPIPKSQLPCGRRRDAVHSEFSRVGRRGGTGGSRNFPAAVNLLLSTYAEPHALGLAQDPLIRATVADNEGVDAFAVRLRSLAELCGNIHSEGTIKQQLIQALPKYLRTDGFVHNTAQRSYQQLCTYVARKYRAAMDVIALEKWGSDGESSRKWQTSTGLRGLSTNLLGSPWDAEGTAAHETVSALPSGTPGTRTVGASPYSRREAPTGPPLCYMRWTRRHRFPDFKFLTDKKRDPVRSAMNTFLRQKNQGADSAQDREFVVALLSDDLLGGGETTKADEGDAPPVATPSKGRRGPGNA